MRGFAWGLLGVAALAVWIALADLLAPAPSRSDLAGFAMLGIGAWCAYLGVSVLAPRGWWTWAFPAAWVGVAVATLFLAYKDTLAEELAYFGPATLAGHVAMHVLVAPIAAFFGFVVGFADPQGGAIVLACLFVALLGGELLRRRLWPRLSGKGTSSPSGVLPLDVRRDAAPEPAGARRVGSR